MNWVDIAILTIIGVSVLISLYRGFTKEALSLAGWIIALWVAFTFADRLVGLLEGHIEVPSLRLAVAFAILFFATLFVAAIINYLAVTLIKKTGLSGTDRMIGIFFGIARGALIVVVLVLLGGLTPMPQDPWWQQARLLHYFQGLAVQARGYLPPDIANSIHY